MKKLFFPLWISMLIAVAGIAQERSFGTLPMARKTGGNQQAGDKMNDSPKYQKALAVYNKLVAARGDTRYPVPSFVMRNEERQVASMNYDNLEITLEERAFDVCNAFGNQSDAAIAFLLGHELTHYYEKHAWRSGFASDYKDLPIGMQLDSLLDDVEHETEADYLGGFLAYSAGYGLFDKGPDLIKNLYKSYDLKDKIPGYPSLSDRQTLTRRSSEKLQRLTQVFDMANLLTAIGNYTDAYQYYRYILMEYQSREIYNNLGVTAVLDAMRYFKEGDLKYRYPVELDLKSSSTRGSGMVDTRTKLLHQALLHFDAAISLDPAYAPAYLNKACAYALLGDTTRARFYADKEARAVALPGTKTATDIDVLIGILEAKAGHTDAAEKIFRTAADSKSALADYNLKVLKNLPVTTEDAGMSSLSKTERIDGQALSLIADDISFDAKKSIQLVPKLTFHQNPKQGPNSFLFISQNDVTNTNTIFHITGPGYKDVTAYKIGLGATRADIVKPKPAGYGAPENTIETPLGQIMVYKNIIFILDAAGKLERWVNYTN